MKKDIDIFLMVLIYSIILISLSYCNINNQEKFNLSSRENIKLLALK